MDDCYQKLKLNKDKAELIYVRDIGAFFDYTLSMIPQFNCVCESASYQLRNIACIRKYLSPKTIEYLVHAFVSSKLHFCNSLLYGISKHKLRKLQSVQNAVAR